VRPPRVSVIVPFYDAERYLGEAIESVLAQTLPAHQLLLVDDASRDGSAEVAARYASARAEIALLRLERNGGPAAARNAGLAAAQGELVTFLDADDRMLPERLELQAAHLRAHPRIDGVVCGEEVVDDPPASRPRAEPRARRNGRFHTMSLMLRRSSLERVGRFDPSYRVAEDLDFLYRAAAAGLVIDAVDRVLTRRRLHDANLSYDTDAIRSGILRSLRSRIAEKRA
jgi:glycosyltransferase involved in cell wall biosynthesis